MISPPAGSPPLFTMFDASNIRTWRTRREAFLLSLAGQALAVGLLTYFTCCILETPHKLLDGLRHSSDVPLVFSGDSGGGGGGFDRLPPSSGTPPRASLDEQLAPPTLIVAKEMPKLPVEETIRVDPGVKLPEGAQLGDPMSRFKDVFSSGPGGPSGWGNGCCNGIGPSKGPGLGDGPDGIHPAGMRGVTVPQAIYAPEPVFSEEARKAKQDGIVELLLVVGKDGHPYGIEITRSLGMGLDEKAVEAVSQWRFKPATLNGQPVATRIAVEVNFHLY